MFQRMSWMPKYAAIQHSLLSHIPRTLTSRAAAAPAASDKEPGMTAMTGNQTIAEVQTNVERTSSSLLGRVKAVTRLQGGRVKRETNRCVCYHLASSLPLHVLPIIFFDQEEVLS